MPPTKTQDPSLQPNSSRANGAPNSVPKRNDSPPPDTLINPTFSLNYWTSFPANTKTMLGALGDYPWYTRIDLRGSKTFLTKIRRMIPNCSVTGKLNLGVDCGAGVGRVTEGLLRDVCERVDAVEPVSKFADVILARKEKEMNSRRPGVIGDVYIMGLENWVPEEKKKYDLIWAQFCANYVTDEQLFTYLSRCREALSETGFVVLKENISTDPQERDMFDEEDSSVTRTDGKFRDLMGKAGFMVLASEVQMGFPKEFNLLPVRFYALRPGN